MLNMFIDYGEGIQIQSKILNIQEKIKVTSKFGEKKSWLHERELALEAALDIGKGDAL